MSRWVIRDIRPLLACPLLLQERTNVGTVGMVAKCHSRPKCAAAKQGYSITSSAVNRSLAGTVKPIDFAVFKLITRSYLVGCW